MQLGRGSGAHRSRCRNRPMEPFVKHGSAACVKMPASNTRGAFKAGATVLVNTKGPFQKGPRGAVNPFGKLFTLAI